MSEAAEQIKSNLGIEDPIKRLVLAAIVAVFTTFSILWLMQVLIATGKGAITSKNEGRYVDLEDTIAGFTAILNGDVDEYAENAFSYVGTIDEAIEKGKKLAA